MKFVNGTKRFLFSMMKGQAWLPGLICRVDTQAALHIQAPEAKIHAQQRVHAHFVFWHARGQEGPSRKPLHKQILGKSRFLHMPPDPLWGYMGDETRNSAGDDQQQRPFIPQLPEERRKILDLGKEMWCSLQTSSNSSYCKLEFAFSLTFIMPPFIFQ